MFPFWLLISVIVGFYLIIPALGMTQDEDEALSAILKAWPSLAVGNQPGVWNKNTSLACANGFFGVTCSAESEGQHVIALLINTDPTRPMPLPREIGKLRWLYSLSINNAGMRGLN
jgi:hypothetical protein